MDAGKSFDFSRRVSGNAGMSSLVTGDPTLAKIDENRVLDQTLSQIDRHIRISDLVWCKDIGQPWWPGKVIGDSMMLIDSDESFDSNVYLVACFGDGSAMWRGVACIKPFWKNFSRLAEQSDTEIFRQAVDCALEEVSRRIKYSLTCSCMPKQICVDVGRPFWGMDSEDKQEVVLSTSSFVPRELVEYLRASAVVASGSDNRLVLEVTIAQLSAFYCWRTRSQELPKYSSLFAELDSDSCDIFSGSSVQNSNDIMNFYGQDISASGGSFPLSQNSWFVAGCAAYGNVTMKDSPSLLIDKGKGKFPVDSDYTGDVSAPMIATESLGDCVTEPNSVQNSNDIMNFYGQDINASGGSFPLSQNSWFVAGCAVYGNVNIKDSPSLLIDNGKGKFPIDSDYSSGVSTPMIATESLGDRVTEPKEKKYATSLHMFFTEWNTVPSEAKLHETFGQFGQLVESDTKLYPKSTAARIVFLQRSAAEAALGIVRQTLPSVVSFKLKPLLLKPVKSSRGRKRQR